LRSVLGASGNLRGPVSGGKTRGNEKGRILRPLGERRSPACARTVPKTVHGRGARHLVSRSDGGVPRSAPGEALCRPGRPLRCGRVVPAVRSRRERSPQWPTYVVLRELGEGRFERVAHRLRPVAGRTTESERVLAGVRESSLRDSPCGHHRIAKGPLRGPSIRRTDFAFVHLTD
jgi:hypothetical protein